MNLVNKIIFDTLLISSEIFNNAYLLFINNYRKVFAFGQNFAQIANMFAIHFAAKLLRFCSDFARECFLLQILPWCSHLAILFVVIFAAKLLRLCSKVAICERCLTFKYLEFILISRVWKIKKNSVSKQMKPDKVGFETN